MRIAKNTEVVLTEVPSSRFLLVVDVMDGDVTLTQGDACLVSLSLDEGGVRARLSYPDGRCAELYGACAAGKEVILTAGYARIGLYVNGVLLDEDFFFTPIQYKDATVHAGSFMHFEAGYEYHSARESAIVENLTDSLDGYRPEGTEYAVFRTMPLVLGERLCLFYLDERHGGTAKDGKGAHKACAMFSDDGVTFHGAPTALAIDNVREENILDASLLRVDGRYYLYYLVDYATHRALTCAVSEDGFSFIKTGLDVEIPTADASQMTAIAVTAHPTPRIYYVAGKQAYVAESIDLLHFNKPAPLPISSVDRVFPLHREGEAFLFFEKDGTLFCEKDGRACAIAPSASPVFYRGALRLIGTKNGAFSSQILPF